MEKIAAIVVTYNRKKLLSECIDAIRGQSYSVSKIIIIDNASTDGTWSELIRKEFVSDPVFRCIRMKHNTGGAGGFYAGLKIFRDEEEFKDYQYVWVMDDDTIPQKDCLEHLVNAELIVEKSGRSASFFASTIYGAGGEYMNVPEISKKISSNGYQYWYEFLRYGIINITLCTFVSVLIRRNAIEKCGLPCKDYFIWGDDSEYTLRLTTFYGDGYFVGKSKAIHKRLNASSLDLSKETDVKRIGMYQYYIRNNYINRRVYRKYYGVSLFGEFMHMKNEVRACISSPNRTQKLFAIFRGYLEAVLECKKFKNYINSQIMTK